MVPNGRHHYGMVPPCPRTITEWCLLMVPELSNGARGLSQWDHRANGARPPQWCRTISPCMGALPGHPTGLPSSTVQHRAAVGCWHIAGHSSCSNISTTGMPVVGDPFSHRNGQAASYIDAQMQTQARQRRHARPLIRAGRLACWLAGSLAWPGLAWHDLA